METAPFTGRLQECLASSSEEAAVLVLRIQERRITLKSALEDLFLGPLASPSFSQGCALGRQPTTCTGGLCWCGRCRQQTRHVATRIRSLARLLFSAGRRANGFTGSI